MAPQSTSGVDPASLPVSELPAATAAASREPESPGPAESAVPPPSNPAANAAKPAVLVVDFRPWARVRISTNVDGVTGLDRTYVTPFSIALPPGEYVVRGENGDLTGPVQMTVRLDAGQTRQISQAMPRFDADRVIESLLSRER
jgi:hypothetical protein